MKVLVIGASGTIGQHLVQQSLKEGHQVTAFCRDPSRLDAHPNLVPFAGDAGVYADVLSAMNGQETVIIVLGSGKKRTGNIRSLGTKHVVQAMRTEGVKRLICQTTLGCGDSHATLNFFWKYIMFGWFLKAVFLDHEAQEKVVKESGLDWTLIRPGAFMDGPQTGVYYHGNLTQSNKLKLKVSRQDVADFLVKQIHSTQYLFKTPGLSY